MQKLLISLPGVLFVFIFASAKSLWIDEAATWWIAQGPFNLLFSDTRPYPNHLPYYLFMWSWIRLFGDSEISLRIPSLVATLVTAFFCCKIAQSVFQINSKQFLGYRTFPLAYLYQEQVLWSVTNARQYSFAILFAILSVYSLLQFSKSGKLKFLLLLSFTAACTLLTQPIFAPFFPILLLGALILPCTGRTRFKQVLYVATILIITAIGCLIFLNSVGTFKILYRLQDIYSFINRPTVPSLMSLFSIASTIPIFLEILLILLIAYFERENIKKIDYYQILSFQNSYFLYFLAAWILVPPVVLIFCSLCLKVDFLLPRYVAYSLPAWALLSGFLIQKLGEIRKPVGYILVLILPLFASVGWARQASDDWRSAMAFVCRKTPDKTRLVGIFSGHPESLLPQWQDTPALQSAWLAPARYYCLDKTVNPFVNIYFSEESPPKIMLDKDLLEGIRSLVFVVNDNADQLSQFLDNKATSLGFYRTRTLSFEGVSVLEFKEAELPKS